MERAMKQSPRQMSGLTVHAIVGASMILFGGVIIATAFARLACLPLPAGVEALVQFELSDYFLPRSPDINSEAQLEECLGLVTIGIVQLVLGVLLIIPSCSPVVGPLASSFWGAALFLRMTQGHPYLLQAVMLVLSWIGLYLHGSNALCSSCSNTIGSQSLASQP
jgi:hypothetical protein